MNQGQITEVKELNNLCRKRKKMEMRKGVLCLVWAEKVSIEGLEKAGVQG